MNLIDFLNNFYGENFIKIPDGTHLDVISKLMGSDGNKPERISKRGKPASSHNISLQRNLLLKRNFYNNFKKARQVLKNFRRTYKQMNLKVGETFKYKTETIDINTDIINDDCLIDQICDYYWALMLKWNEHSICKERILFAQLLLFFEYNDGQKFVIKQAIPNNFNLCTKSVKEELKNVLQGYNKSNVLNRLNKIEFKVFYDKSTNNPLLKAYGSKKKLKGSIFSPVLYNWNCCMSEIACYLMFRNSSFVEKQEYKYTKQHEWAYLNMFAITGNLFTEEIKQTFYSADIKSFIIAWNSQQKMIDIVLFNSVTSEYFPYDPQPQTNYVVFWYPYHVELFIPSKMPLPKIFKLSPPKPSPPQVKEQIICTIDIETYCLDKEGTQKPYLICFYSSEFNISFKLTNNNDILDELMDFLLLLKKQSKNKEYIIWAHNGMKFDYVFMIPYLIKRFNIRISGKLNELKSIQFANIKFLDFYKFFNNSLNDLSKNFLGKQKLEFDFTLVYDQQSANEKMEEACKYCMMDCTLLYDLVTKFNSMCIQQFSVSINDCFSASHLAKTIYQLKYLDVELKGSILDDYNIEKSSYHGGMCIAYVKGFYNNPIYVYDVNSSYPYAMLHEMPYIFTKTKEIKKNNKIIKHYLYEITFSFPEYTRICNLASKVDDEMVFLRNGSGWYWGCEIEIAIKLGAFITFETVRKYKPKKIFDKYILDLYNKRKQAKIDKDDILNELYKRLLNSLYGKFGQKLRHQSYVEKYDSFLQNNLQLNDIHILDDNCVYIEYKDNFQHYHNIGSLVRLSSYISAFARCTLLTPILNINHDNVLYMDTDSLFLTKELNEKWLNNDELGKFKKEVYEGGIFVSSKNYMLFPNTKKMKGVNIKNVTKNNYLSLINTGFTFVKTTSSVREFGNVKISDTNKLVTTYSYKRELKGFYTLPHSDKDSFTEYKKKQLSFKKHMVQANIKSTISDLFLKESKFILNSISNCSNLPIILPHKSHYESFSIDEYLKHRILSYSKNGFTIQEKEHIYKFFFKENSPDIRKCLLSLYGYNDNIICTLGKDKIETLRKNGYCLNWKIKDIGILKKMFIELQYNYIRETTKII